MIDTLTHRLLEFVRDEIVLVDLELTDATDLLLTGAVDSLGIIRITQWIEDEAGVSVDPGDVTIENFQTIGRMITYLETRSTA